MVILKRLLNSIVFWGAWIVIPVLMEILPAFFSIFLLLRRRHRENGYPAPPVWPEISLLIPVYNSQDTLYQCLESIHHSTYPNKSIRVFLINNHTPDNSFAEYARAQRDFPELRMQWLNAEQGKSRALNLALYNSEGKYIVNIDSDGLLERTALTNLVKKFEARPELNCMTGSILTLPEAISRYKSPLGRLLRELEFVEYAQAFMAGRSYASETNSIYTLSGAFSAFRKSAVLSSWMYNTDTICEDTHMTFQIRQRQGDRVEICEDAVFFVDPIEDLNKLYTQRQRWQRGSLEVAKMFMDENFRPGKILSDVSVRTLLYDHTFAFPRMIWYLAMLCLMAMNYSVKVILFSGALIFSLYIAVGLIYYFTVVHLLKFAPDIRKYYAARWWCVPLLPFFNLMVFFIRMAGIINSVNTTSAWRTKNLSEEWEDFTTAVREMVEPLVELRLRIQAKLNRRRATGQAVPDGRGGLKFLSVCLLGTIAALLAAGAIWANARQGLLDRYIALGKYTEIFEEDYVDPATVAVTAQGETRNLILICLESMETTYASRSVGGGQGGENYIPNLTEFARENVSFSDNGALGGSHATAGTTTTEGALLAATGGTPLLVPEGAQGSLENFGSLTTLGDILAGQGYRQEFLCGSEADLSGRRSYFESHGNCQVFDIYTARQRGYVAADYWQGWGLEDKVLLDIARDEVTRLSRSGQPFCLTLLTSDLAAPNGYRCRWCPEDYPRSQTGTVAACTDRLVGEFLYWCQRQDFFENTLIVVVGDHPRQDDNLVAGADDYDRTVYNCFINSAAPRPSGLRERTFTAEDLYPTILSAMGFTVGGDRLGLGTDLFSGERTLLERRGRDWLNGELGKISSSYLQRFFPETEGAGDLP